MKIIAVILVYNCGDVLFNTLESLDGRVDEIHCYDTCWLPFHSPHSTDDTKAVIEKFSQTSKTKADYTELPSPMGEGHARTQSIKNIAEGDWVFVIDSDEVVIRWNDNVRSILEKSVEKGYYWFMDDKVFQLCRLFRKIEGMKYFFCTPFTANGKPLAETFPIIDINVRHDFKKRTRERHASETAQRPHP